MALQLFTVFHLNLAFSSLEEEQRAEVIQRCYWPLLRAAQIAPLGIEATGYTLEAIQEIDPLWIDQLHQLLDQRRCEFVGSGYAQLIGPLIPAEMIAANLKIGHEVYERVLGRQPTLALINEQSYSSGLVQHYLDAGYEAIVMEWDNPASRRGWSKELAFLPQFACDGRGAALPVIWNHSVGFQKFQRYAHGELELDEIVGYLSRHCSPQRRAFSLYGSDAEVFDYRPGRYRTEVVQTEPEWTRIELLLKTLAGDPAFEMALPSAVLRLMGSAGSGNELRIDSAPEPVPVKKQPKYNVTRWAVSGRNDTAINTACWRIKERLLQQGWPLGPVKELCYLWSSDFRTHITAARWQEYLDRLRTLEAQVGAGNAQPAATDRSSLAAGVPARSSDVRRHGRFLQVDLPRVRLRLNCRRGLAIDQLIFPDVSDDSLIGTLPHGFFSDIGWLADFYSGHLVFQAPGRAQVTDLSPVEPEVFPTEGGVGIRCSQLTAAGRISKSLIIADDPPSLEINYFLDWERIPLGSLRLGHVTVNPAAFSADTLFYETANGGWQADRYALGREAFDHGRSVSFLVSAAQAIGATDGRVVLGDAQRSICIDVNKSLAALIGLVSYQTVGESYFFRLAWSAKEVDDTSREEEREAPESPRHFQLRIAP